MIGHKRVFLAPGIDDTAAVFDRFRPVLEKSGWVVHVVEFAPGNGDVGIDLLAGQLARLIRQYVEEDGEVNLVGFSMGGLVARVYAQRLAGARRIRKLVTVSSPHHGTYAAYLRSNEGARQMRPGSEFLKGLEAEASEVDFTSIWNPFDLMILPATSSVVGGARNVRVAGMAHAWMMRDERVMKAILEALHT